MLAGWLTSKELYEKLDLDYQIQRKLRRRGRLPYAQFGSRIFYRASDVDAMLQSFLRRDFEWEKQ